ncbi:MAG: ribbon-helix-helix domain-containing protein [Mobilicoccus sp.]|nr:ribbon-helix-helix domain-containing protein [Mobilicoccus sp.]
MKLSVSLSEADVAALDRYVAEAGLASRSAGVAEAVRRLRDPQLEADYAAAWQEWVDEGHEDAWSVTTADGLSDAAR